jgi:hypothetical protein
MIRKDFTGDLRRLITDDEFRAAYSDRAERRVTTTILVGRVVFLVVAGGLLYLYLHNMWLHRH